MPKPKNPADRYLWPRKESAFIWFRLHVPKKYQEAVGKRLIAESLGTTDFRKARVMAGKRRAQLLEEWSALSATPKVPDIDMSRVAVTVGFDDMLASMDERRKEWPVDDADYDMCLAEREASRRRWIRHLQDGDLSRWEPHADRLIANRGGIVDKGSDEYVRFVEEFAECSIDAIGVQTRRARGELNAEPQSSIVREVKAREGARARPGENLLDLFEKWAAERRDKGRKRLDTINQDRKKIEQFANFVGRDRGVASITAGDIFEYRELLRDLPPKWASKKLLKNLSLREAARRARELNMPNTAYTTVNSHLSVISPLYKWLAKQPAWVGLPNPCDNLFHDDVKGRNPRPPLSTKALNTLLASPLFVGFLKDGQEHVPGHVQADDWRKWVLLATMFTGARLGEIAQLRIRDLYEDRGVWLVHIREEESDGLTTKNRAGHHVPLHSKLIAMGFIDFVERESAARGENAPLFAGIKRNSRGHFGAVARWFRDYFAAIGVKNGRDGIGAHSFRHTLTDRLRSEAELLDAQIAVILDHSTKTTTAGYGRLSQGTISMMKEWIEAVTWDGVDFSHLMSRA